MNQLGLLYLELQSCDPSLKKRFLLLGCLFKAQQKAACPDIPTVFVGDPAHLALRLGLAVQNQD